VLHQQEIVLAALLPNQCINGAAIPILGLQLVGDGRVEIILGNIEFRTAEQAVVEADFGIALRGGGGHLALGRSVLQLGQASACLLDALA
jgi:hypothetical protein